MDIFLRRLDLDEMEPASRVLRVSFDERLPWLAGLHTPEEDLAFFRDHLFTTCEVWGAFDRELAGIVAFRDGWLNQLYVLPSRQGKGVGSALLDVAMAFNSHLQLWTFQRNGPARAFYERRGFLAISETDGSGNEEREPDVLYRWDRERAKRAETLP